MYEIDSKITFLLGAGASIPAKIPDVRRFADAFEDSLKRRFGKGHALSQELDRLRATWAEVTKGKHQPLDLERLYELLTFIDADPDARPIPTYLPASFPKRSREIELLAWELKKYVQERCLSVKTRDLAYLRPLARFTDISRPLSIITLNYDACLETVLDQERLTWSDGAPADGREFFSGHLVFPNNVKVHLIKLHGSVTWYQTRLETEPGWMRRVRARAGQVGVSLRLRAARSLTHEAMMIYPTLNKALTTGPFPTLATQALRALERSKLCIAIGYAFGDAHVRRLLFEALSLNSHLRLVLVNPQDREVLKVLYSEAAPDIQERIGTASSQSDIFGRVEKALKGDWLLDRAKAWLQGAVLDQPYRASRGLVGSPKTPLCSPNRWELRYPIPNGVAGIARGMGVLYLARRSRNEVCELTLADGNLRVVASGIQSLHGLTVDPSTGLLYAVSNKYGLQPRLPWSRGGVGQLWEIDPSSGMKSPLTRIHWLPTLLNLFAGWLKHRRVAPWKELRGALSWPTSVIVEDPGRSLLLTEAKTIKRIDLKTRRLSTAIEVPLGFNIVGLALEAPGLLLVAEAGVHPNGYGRLLRIDLNSKAVEILGGGWHQIGALSYWPAARKALLSQGQRWPLGRVFSVDLDKPDLGSDLEWRGLNAPTHLVSGESDFEFLVSAREGVVSLFSV